MEDSISTDGERGGGDGSAGNASDGERQMKLPLLAALRSPPALWPGS